MDYQIAYKKISKTIPTKVALSIMIDDKLIMTDQVDLGKMDKRKQFVQSLIKEYPGLEAECDSITEELLHIAAGFISEEEPEEEDQIQTPLEQSEIALAETDEELVSKAVKLLKEPQLIQYVIKHIEIFGLVGEEMLGLALYLTFTSRLLCRINHIGRISNFR